jgi:hypothetical protein
MVGEALVLYYLARWRDVVYQNATRIAFCRLTARLIYLVLPHGIDPDQVSGLWSSRRGARAHAATFSVVLCLR